MTAAVLKLQYAQIQILQLNGLSEEVDLAHRYYCTQVKSLLLASESRKSSSRKDKNNATAVLKKENLVTFLKLNIIKFCIFVKIAMSIKIFKKIYAANYFFVCIIVHFLCAKSTSFNEDTQARTVGTYLQQTEALFLDVSMVCQDPQTGV